VYRQQPAQLIEPFLLGVPADGLVDLFEQRTDPLVLCDEEGDHVVLTGLRGHL